MEDAQRDQARTTLAQVFALIVVLTLLLMIISFPVGLYTVFYTKLSNSSTYNSPVHGIVLLVALIPLTIPVVTSVGTAFTVFLAIYAIFFITAALQKVRILIAVRESVETTQEALFRNPLSATIVTLGSLTFGLTVLDVIQTRSGIPTGQITGDPLYLFLGITMAPLTEELGFRLALIGIPVLLVVAFSGSSLKRIVKCLWRPSAAWEQSPDDTASTNPAVYSVRKLFTYVLLFLSSILFGLAHFLANSGWDAGKVSEAAIAGVALGYLYIKYGLHTNVLLHWGVNYFGTAYAFLSQGLWNVPWTSDTGSPLSLFVEVLIILVLGFPSFSIVIYKFLKKVSRASEVDV